MRPKRSFLLEKEPKDHFFSSRKEAKAFSFFDKEKQKERLGISPSRRARDESSSGRKTTTLKGSVRCNIAITNSGQSFSNDSREVFILRAGLAAPKTHLVMRLCRSGCMCCAYATHAGVFVAFPEESNDLFLLKNKEKKGGL
jgi:hypothetical protein